MTVFSKETGDFDFLNGHFDVRHRTLTKVFVGSDDWQGQSIDVRFLWTPGSDRAAWEQSFSTDGGKTWIANWKMTHTRTA